MTRIQMKYYRAVRDWKESHGYSPSYSEIAKVVGVSSLCTVAKAISALITQGYLQRDPEATNVRNLVVVPAKMNTMNSCNRGHPPIWFMTQNCPLCEVLTRFSQP